MRAPLSTALAAVASLFLLSPSPAAAQSAQDRPGFDIGLRLSAGLPLGKIASGTLSGDLSDSIKVLIPLQLDLGYRVNGTFTVGGYFAYGYAVTKGCDPGSSCSATDTRVGLQGTMRFPSGGSFVPWVGLGLGYEWLTLKQDSQSASVKGWEFLNLQVGGSFLASPEFGIGPFASFSVARYGEIEYGGVSVDIPDTAFHEWLQIGVRGTFSL
jgi:hypothetical protein